MDQAVTKNEATPMKASYVVNGVHLDVLTETINAISEDAPHGRLQVQGL